MSPGQEIYICSRRLVTACLPGCDTSHHLRTDERTGADENTISHTMLFSSLFHLLVISLSLNQISLFK